MPAWDRVAVLGVGLMGGSLGAALLKRGVAREVVGFDTRPAAIDEALSLGAITSGVATVREAVEGAALVVVAAWIDAAPALVREAAEHMPPGGLITDLGSSKGAIQAAIGPLPRGVVFVGSHPMAGTEKSGPLESDADLYVGRLVAVCAQDSTPPAATDTICKFWEALGARVERIAAADHDRLVAAASHLPHLISACLAASLPPEAWRWGAGGLRDMTRIAAADPEKWRQTLLSNREETLAALAAFEGQLHAARAALAHDDAQSLVQLLSDAQRSRHALGS